MRKEEHLVIGLISSLIIGFLINKYVDDFEFFHLILFLPFSGLGSILPDELEPPTNWRHRSFFHSQFLLCLSVGISLLLLIGVIINQSLLAYFSLAFLIGYISHLLADSTTSQGLPRI